MSFLQARGGRPRLAMTCALTSLNAPNWAWIVPMLASKKQKYIIYVYIHIFYNLHIYIRRYCSGISVVGSVFNVLFMR